jgi:hypothetical protein
MQCNKRIMTAFNSGELCHLTGHSSFSNFSECRINSPLFIQTVQIWSRYLHNEMRCSACYYPTSAVIAAWLFKLDYGFQIIRSTFYTFERCTSFLSTVIYQQREILPFKKQTFYIK